MMKIAMTTMLMLLAACGGNDHHTDLDGEWALETTVDPTLPPGGGRGGLWIATLWPNNGTLRIFDGRVDGITKEAVERGGTTFPGWPLREFLNVVDDGQLWLRWSYLDESMGRLYFFEFFGHGVNANLIEGQETEWHENILGERFVSYRSTVRMTR